MLFGALYILLTSYHPSILNGRLEYCISGSVVQDAGNLLGLAKSGEISIAKNCWLVVKKKLQRSINDTDKDWIFQEFNDDINGAVPGTVMKSIPKSKIYKKAFGKDIQNGILINQEDYGIIDVVKMLQRVAVESIKGGYELLQYANQRQLEFKTLAYIEESLSKYLLNSSTSSEEGRDYNQIRSIISVFIRFPSLDVSSFSNPETVDKANKALCICLEETRKQGGCCRQFGCDDKAATVLLVWGMEGYAHERGEALHAVSAALEISKGFKSLFGKEFSIGIASGSV